MPLKQNRSWSDHTTNNYNDYDLPKNWMGSDDGFPEKKELNGAYAYPDGNIPIGQSAHENGLGNNPWEAQTNVQGVIGPHASQTPYGPTVQGLKNIVNDISRYEQLEAGVNPNLKANPIYGYGSPALEYDFDENKYPWSDELNDYTMPKDQDTLFWHIVNEGDDYVDWFNDITKQAGTDDTARAFTLLRNLNDWQHSQEADEAAKIGRARNLYGETLYNLLQDSQQGRSILDSLPNEYQRRSRERNITGQGTGGYIK